jgi:hypothetical protein
MEGIGLEQRLRMYRVDKGLLIGLNKVDLEEERELSG